MITYQVDTFQVQEWIRLVSVVVQDLSEERRASGKNEFVSLK